MKIRGGRGRGSGREKGGERGAERTRERGERERERTEIDRFWAKLVRLTTEYVTTLRVNLVS